jgi:hypothetical protein
VLAQEARAVRVSVTGTTTSPTVLVPRLLPIGSNSVSFGFS